MEQPPTADNSSQGSVAMLFTNNLGQVIFVDHSFLQLMKYSEAGVVTGEPLYKVLRTDQKAANQLLDEMRKNGRVRDQRLDLLTASNTILHVACTGTASFDPGGSFIGADLTLRALFEATGTAVLQRGPEAAASRPPTRQMAPEAASPDNDMFLQLYFVEQIKTIYVLVGRLVGLGARDRLDKLINETAQRGGWKISIKSGLFTTDLAGAPIEAYRALLSKAYGHAVNMIGQRVVEREVKAAEAHMHQGLLLLAGDAGLRSSLGISR